MFRMLGPLVMSIDSSFPRLRAIVKSVDVGMLGQTFPLVDRRELGCLAQ